MIHYVDLRVFGLTMNCQKCVNGEKLFKITISNKTCYWTRRFWFNRVQPVIHYKFSPQYQSQKVKVTFNLGVLSKKCQTLILCRSVNTYWPHSRSRTLNLRTKEYFTQLPSVKGAKRADSQFQATRSTLVDTDSLWYVLLWSYANKAQRWDHPIKKLTLAFESILIGHSYKRIFIKSSRC